MENKKIKAIVFDLDGTLLDTLDDLADSCNLALKENGLPEHTRDEIRNFLGNGMGVLIEKAVPDGRKNPLYESVGASMKKFYKQNWLNKTKPYRGIENLLAELKRLDIKIGIVSNKPDAPVKDLAKMFFSDHMDIENAVGEKESQGIKRKPAPDSVLHVLKRLGVEKENAIYVGDSDVDIRTAENAGMDCISVCWGFRSKDFLMENGAKILIENPEEILGFCK